MVRTLRHRIVFLLERWLQRGVFYQLLMVAALIVLVALLGGLAAFAFTPAFSNPLDAIWWSFLRLTDPGYLGDDEGLALRVISTIVTVLGYVLFMGSLIAILSQALDQTMERLERGLTPIALRDHILILGWTSRTAPIVKELLLSQGRIQRFLRLRGRRSIRIVILSTASIPDLRVELREELGKHYTLSRLLLRSGSPLRPEHLDRVAFRNAAIIILPGETVSATDDAAQDSRVVKTLLSMSGAEPPLPSVVAEIGDVSNVPIAQEAYHGETHLVAGDAVISRLIAQTIRNPGLTKVYSRLLSHSGSGIYIRGWPALTGQTFREVAARFDAAVPLGFVRTNGEVTHSTLCPPTDYVLAENDELVFMARDYEACIPSTSGRSSQATTETGRPLDRQAALRILLLGWSHLTPTLLAELDHYEAQQFEVVVLSRAPIEERAARMRDASVQLQRIQVTDIVGDYVIHSQLESIEPGRFHAIVLQSTSYTASLEASDARSVMGYLQLANLLDLSKARPKIIVELQDPDNTALFDDPDLDILPTPRFLSHIMANVGLRPALQSVFDELFGPRGADICFRPAADFGVVGTAVTFGALRGTARVFGEVALGIRRGAEVREAHRGLHLNPSRQSTWTLAADDAVIVLVPAQQ